MVVLENQVSKQAHNAITWAFFVISLLQTVVNIQTQVKSRHYISRALTAYCVLMLQRI